MLKTGKKAASVFPVAVGDIKRTFLPSRTLGIVLSCGSVGLGNPLCSISLRTGLTSRLKESLGESFKLGEPQIQKNKHRPPVKAFWGKCLKKRHSSLTITTINWDNIVIITFFS